MELLRQRGYGIHSDRLYAIRLNVASKTERRKWDGQPRRELLRGLSKDELDACLSNCETVEEAAMMVEKLSHGEVMSAVEETRPSPNGLAGISVEQIAKIIESRTTSIVGERLQEFRSEMNDLRTDMSNVLGDLKQLLGKQKNPPAVATKKKRGRPSKLAKLSDDEVETIVANMGIPAEPNFNDEPPPIG